MKHYPQSGRPGGRTLFRRRPLSVKAIRHLIERRQRVRKRIGMALALCATLGLLLVEFE
jgi:hypothetical protein